MKKQDIRKIVLIFIFLVTFNFLSDGQTRMIDNIIISGNKKTKEMIIIHELTFKIGDTINEKEIENSRNNLLNTSLFNFVTINYNKIDSNFTVNIIVEERWYVWPSLTLNYADRNFSAWLKNGDLSKSNYGFSIDRYNFRGCNEKIKFSVILGYEKQVSISYKNIALNNSKTQFIGANIEYSGQDEIIYKTEDNKPKMYKQEYEMIFTQKKITLNYSNRPTLYQLHNFHLNYIRVKVSDTITKLNPNYLIFNRNSMNFFTLDYSYSLDRRDLVSYPLTGFLIRVNVSQTLSSEFIKNFFSYSSIMPNIYKFMKIRNKIYFSTGLNSKVSFNTNYCYTFSESFGYYYNLQGFEYNIVDGQNFVLLKNLLKFVILPTKTTQINFIPIPKFNKIHYSIYFNLYSNWGYVSNKFATVDNTYANQFLYSGGAGIDIVTYYDRVFRFEYSINKFGKSGFFIHFSAAINN